MSDVQISSMRQTWSRPGKPIGIGLGVLGLFGGAVLGWSLLAPLSDAAVAAGSLEVEGRRQSVQHPQGGVIRELRVEEGETVSRGQILATLQNTEAQARLDVLQTQYGVLTARHARLIAERDGTDLTTSSPDVGTAEGEAIASEQALLHARNRSHVAMVNVIHRQIAGLREMATGAGAEAEGLARQRALITEELHDARGMLEKGLTTRPRVLALEREASQLNGAEGAKRAEVAAAEQQIAEAKAEIARIDRDRLSEIAETLGSTEAELAGIRPQILTAEDTLERMQIRAPAAGRVVGLSVFTEGGVIGAGTPLMEIVPSDAQFFVDARLALTDLHGIERGQRGEIELLSLPRRIRPDLSGEVTNVSPDRMTDERSGEGYYAVQLRLDPEDLVAMDMHLQAGMPVQVILPTRARTLMDYLTSPLFDEIGTAFRED